MGGDGYKGGWVGTDTREDWSREGRVGADTRDGVDTREAG